MCQFLSVYTKNRKALPDKSLFCQWPIISYRHIHYYSNNLKNSLMQIVIEKIEQQGRQIWKLLLLETQFSNQTCYSFHPSPYTAVVIIVSLWSTWWAQPRTWRRNWTRRINWLASNLMNMSAPNRNGMLPRRRQFRGWSDKTRAVGWHLLFYISLKGRFMFWPMVAHLFIH